ncbi:MAG: TolC family protein, partial [Phycisphaerae bacterium]
MTFLLFVGMGVLVDAGSAASPPATGPPANMVAASNAATQEQGEDTNAPNGEPGGEPTIPPERLAWHVPDPELAREKALKERERAEQANDQTRANYCTRVLERIDTIHRTQQVRLTLEDVIHRTLANNYTIETLSYNPAIETTRVVEAEAAFDAVFFTNLVKNHVDRPTGSQLMAQKMDFLQINSGIRKLLPSGMQVSGQYQFQRTNQAFAYQEINPEYVSKFIGEFRQPILRNFGIDFNRSLILISRTDRRISDLAFQRQVRDILRRVEEYYWRLVQARCDVVITARLLADFEAIYEYLVARKDFDIRPVQIAATKADLDQARTDFVRRRDNVFDAEDGLIALMNDPNINLADDTEIILENFPHLEPIVVDRLAEVQSALDHRTEIKEQELQIAKAKIMVGRAKNAELPRFDLTFRTTFDGLAGTADKSFDEVTRRKFIEYYVGVELEVPIGNRGPRAAHRLAQLQHAQAVAQLRRVFEDVILDVNLAVRQLETSYDQIGPSFESAESRELEVESIVARAERKDYNTLINELGARQQ